MADWITIADSQLDPDAPLTSELAYAWRDNSIAIAEGAPGAPRVQPEARRLILYQNNALTTTPVTVTGLRSDIYVSLYGFISVIGAGSSATVQMRFSSDGGATFGAWGNLTATSTGVAPASGQEIMLSLTDGRILVGHGANSTGQPFLLTSSAPVNAIGFRVDGSGTLQGASVYLIGEGSSV